MKSPFPGMDPYLEQHWRDVHASLIIYIRDQLQPTLPDDLLARVEERVFVEAADGEGRSMYPDVRVVEHGQGSAATPATEGGIAVAEPLLIHVQAEPVTETFLEILDTGSGNRVVTVVEVLSMSNKVAGEGHEQYVQKQRELTAGQVSLVEIDLLRAGRRVLSVPQSRVPPSHRTPYQVCVRRGWRSSVYEVYAVPLRTRLPVIKVPLRQKDRDALLDLQALIDQSYRNGRYHTLDYTVDPAPPLARDDAAWADELLRKAGKRPSPAAPPAGPT